MLPFLLAVLLSWIGSKLPEWLPWVKQCQPMHIDTLPEQPGVYILYNRRGRLIHVGHSGNIRQRLSTHPKRMKIARFDWCPMKNKKRAYSTEMKLQKRHGYNGR